MGFGGPGFKHFHCVGCGKMIRGVPETPAQPLCDACSGGTESGAEDSEIDRLKKERDEAKAQAERMDEQNGDLRNLERALFEECNQARRILGGGAIGDVRRQAHKVMTELRQCREQLRVLPPTVRVRGGQPNIEDYSITKARLRELLPEPYWLFQMARRINNDDWGGATTKSECVSYMNKAAASCRTLRRELGLDDDGRWDHAVTLDDDDRELGLDSTGG